MESRWHSSPPNKGAESRLETRGRKPGEPVGLPPGCPSGAANRVAALQVTAFRWTPPLDGTPMPKWSIRRPGRLVHPTPERGILDRAAAAGALVVDDLDMLAHVMFGAVCAGVLAMVRSEDPAAERERFRSVILTMMSGVLQAPGS